MQEIRLKRTWAGEPIPLVQNSHAAQARRWREMNPEKAAQMNRDSQSKLRAKKRAVVKTYKADRGCADCGESDVIVLELDHRDPSTKTRNSLRSKEHPNGKHLIWSLLSWPALYAELEKCDVVCANCHRRRTAKQQEWG